MGKTLILGTILGAIVLYIWMTVSWMVLPWHCTAFQKFAHEESVASVLMSNTKQSGNYLLPNMCDQKATMERQSDVMKNNPIVFMAIQRNGFNIKSPIPYILSFIIMLFGAFFATFLLLHAQGLNYFTRVWFITIFGIGAGILASFPDWNWWGFSLSYAVIHFLDFVIGWFLAGLVIAAVDKR